MSTLNRRTQILLDEARYEQLERVAAESGRSVASLIREAIDEKLGVAEEEAHRRAAARALLDEPTSDTGREPDWEDVKNDLFDELYERYYPDQAR